MLNVIVDTDPGTDDALAMMMALNSSHLDVRGITTVGGNASLAHTTRNALGLMDHLGLPDVPVSRGAARPLEGKFRYAYYFHGTGGLTVRLPAPQSRPLSVRAPEFITSLASALRGELVVIALGPLTNIARALSREPRLASWTKQIVVMGGALEAAGNVTPHAEFNVYNDPVATGIVLSSGVAVTLVGLDVCSQTYFVREDRPWFPGESKTAALGRQILANWFRSHPERDRYELCDPLATVAAIQPDLLAYRRAKVTVETQDREHLGRTVASYGDGPVRVAVGVDAERCKALITRLVNGGES